MTMTLRIVVIVVSVLTTAMILRKIRQSKLQIEDSIFWIGFSSILILFSVFPCVPDFLSRLAGTYTTANFIYLAVIFLLILKMFHMSIKMSQLETKIKELAQEMALSEHDKLPDKKYVVIQATNVGMYPHTEKAVVEEEAFYAKISVGYDLIYNPAKTLFMQKVEEAGGKAYNGLKMLLYQGIIAYELWNDCEIPDDMAEQVYARIKESL